MNAATNTAINVHNDILRENNGHGSDIATQRMDELDSACLADAQQRHERGPFVFIDVGVGRCGFINKVAEKTHGSVLWAADIEDFSHEAAPGVRFIQADMCQLPGQLPDCDILYSQRTIHYLCYESALQFLMAFRLRMRQYASLYLSCSGVTSELAHGYPGAELPVERRFHHLASLMQNKHGIRQPVCLYSAKELTLLVERAGFHVEEVWQSEFGNVKLTARNIGAHL
jgi:hypothetical protein